MPLFSEIFQGRLSPDVLGRVHKALGDEGTIEDAIDSIFRQGNLAKNDIIVLQFSRLLANITEEEANNAPVSVWITKQLPELTKSRVASFLFPRAGLDEILEKKKSELPPDYSKATWDQIRSRLFDKEPLRVMLALVDAGKFRVDEKPRKIVEQALEEVILDGFETGGTGLLSRVRRNKMFEDGDDRVQEVALSLAKAVVMLPRVVQEAEDAPLLYSKGYDSVRKISLRPKETFQRQMSSAGMTQEAVLKVHDTAHRLDCWNEQLWLALMQAARKDFVGIAPHEGDTVINDGRDRPNQAHNNLTDMFRLEDVACEECCSITSLSSYLTDLLGLLRSTPIENQKEPQSLLDVLKKRRPDLTELHLTCANSQTLVPYVSLVNEVLESFIRYTFGPRFGLLPGSALVKAYNTPADAAVDVDESDHLSGPVYRPGNTDSQVYQHILVDQVFPFTAFPYSQARDVMVNYFDFMKVPFLDLVRVFAAPGILLQNVNDLDLRLSLKSGIQEVLERQQAAEVLGLSQAGFAAITDETFFPQAVADVLSGCSGNPLDIDTRAAWDVAELWGYGDAASMVDIKEGKGLSFIKRQFMRRSGLDFQGVLDLVQTQCFHQQLVITNSTGSGTFDNSLEELRLLSNASDPPFQPLSERICFDLQAFLRLQSVLQWSTKTLDAAIYCLHSSATAEDNRKAISPFVMKSLAAICELAKLGDQEPALLLPLWGPIDAFGDESLLYRQFLTPALREIDVIFTPPRQGQSFLQVNNTPQQIRTHDVGLCAAFNWPVEYFEDLLAVTDLEEEMLNVDSFSTVYRHVMLCRILDVSPAVCSQFFTLLSSQGRDPFASPAASLAVVRDWKTLFEGGWTVESLYRTVVDGKGDEDADNPTEHREDSDTDVQSGLRLVANICDGAKGLTKSLPFLFSGSLPTTENVIDCSVRTFDTQTAKIIIQFVEDTQVQSELLTLQSQDELKELNVLTGTRSRIQIIPSPTRNTIQAEIKLCGLPSTSLRKKIDQLRTDGKLAVSTQAALQKLVDKSLAAQSILSKRFGEAALGSDNVLMKDWPFEPAESDQEDDKNREIGLRSRRRAFIDLAGPEIIRNLLEAVTVNTVKDMLPEVDSSLVGFLLRDVVKVPAANKGEDSAMHALQDLSKRRDYVAEAQTLSAYLTADSTDLFTMTYDGPTKKAGDIKLSVNGIDMACSSASSSPVWIFRIIGGQPYLLEGNFPPAQLSWSTTKTVPAKFTEEMLLPTDSVQRAIDSERCIRRVATITTLMKLTREELEYLTRQNQKQKDGPGGEATALGIDLNAPTLHELLRLQQYRQLRQETHGAANSSSLISLFLWLATTDEASMDVLSRKIAASTGWQIGAIARTLTAKYPRHTKADFIKSLLKFDELLSLHATLRFQDQLGRGVGTAVPPAASQLFGLAQPRFTLAAVGDYKEAQRLASCSTPSQRAACHEKLMGNQRRALVAFLLEQPDIRDGMKVTDADGLFEHFLIDVQMGPQLRTSRIKQAISTVQLFAQRCSLGLEPDVAKDTLDRAKWDWRQQYTLWEAHRKLFLYPENWIDPTLRDDKSALFDQFEASLMQKDFSISTFTEAIQTYVQGLGEIGSLDIGAYLHEGRKNTADVFHFFGRTRTLPQAIYYRTLTIYRPGNEIIWQPWTKIEMDIPSVEHEWDGVRLEQTGTYLLPVLNGNRLYLFMPQIVPRTVEPEKPKGDGSGGGNNSGSKKLTDMTQDDFKGPEPKHVWEVTMAWTEFLKGSWTPKRMSSGSLSIEADAQTASQFRFDPMWKLDKLTLLVKCSKPGLTTSSPVGSFVFCEDQMKSQGRVDVKEEESDISKFAYSADFQKVCRLNEPPIRGDIKTTPLLWRPQDVDAPATSIEWTLSKAPARTTGLVLSVQGSDGKSKTFFNQPKRELLETEWTQQFLKDEMALVPVDHQFAPQLLQAAADRVDPLQHIYSTIASVQEARLPAGFGAGSHGLYHELGQPNALYNWELGMHTVQLAVDRFAATQQFEEALQVARLVFDPTSDVEVHRSIKTPNGEEKVVSFASAWRFPPFQDIARQTMASGERAADQSKLSHEIELAIQERRSHGALVHATARGRPQAYMKWFVMKYVEILIASGDRYFRQATLECLPLATQRYVEAGHILGPAPPRMPRLGDRTTDPFSFDDLGDIDDEFELNLGHPFSPELRRRGTADPVEPDPSKENMMCTVRTTYFGVPMNPKVRQLRNLLNERVFNLRHNRDIDGRPIVYALREPPIDPGALVALSKQGLGLSDALGVAMGDWDSPLPYQRFEVLLRRALDLCSELRSLSEHFLGAVEKKEGEAFSALRARHTTAIQKRMLDIRQLSLDEANQTLAAMEHTREAQVAQLAYYMALIGEDESKIPKKPADSWTDIEQDIEAPTKDDLRMSSFEKKELDMALAASVLNVVATGIDTLVAPFCMVPQMESYACPLGFGASMSIGGSNITTMMQAGSAAIKMAGMVLNDESTRAGRKAQLTRQLQERRFQANVHGREIKATDRQMDIQRLRIQAATQEVAMQRAEMDEASQVEAWYRTKYTSEKLYGWMEKSLRDLCYQAYTLAMTAARRAESALAFEQGQQVSLLRAGGYWDAAHDGLLSADHLYLDLKRLETSYLETGSHDYEVSKTVSLRDVDPLALLRLRVTGRTGFSLNEMLFDMDFPGHYMRRLRSVSVTVPTILSAYTGVNATLTLLQHKYRSQTGAATAEEYKAAAVDPGSESFRTSRIPISSVAVSSGSADAGVFDLSFAGPRYMPFEGAGAISTWSLELPTEVRQFDYGAISDVILNLQYTAKSGGACLQAAANATVREAMQDVKTQGSQRGCWAMVDLEHDVANEWLPFRRQLEQSEEASMPLGNLRCRFPYWARSEGTLEVQSVTLVSQDAKLLAGLSLSVVPSGRQWQEGSIGKATMRTCAGLTARKLDDWVLSAPKGLVDKGSIIQGVNMVLRFKVVTKSTP